MASQTRSGEMKTSLKVVDDGDDDDGDDDDGDDDDGDGDDDGGDDYDDDKEESINKQPWKKG